MWKARHQTHKNKGSCSSPWQWFSTKGDFAHQGHSATSWNISGGCEWERGTTGIPQLEARNTARYPTMGKTASHNKELFHPAPRYNLTHTMFISVLIKMTNHCPRGWLMESNLNFCPCNLDLTVLIWMFVCPQNSHARNLTTNNRWGLWN